MEQRSLRAALSAWPPARAAWHLLRKVIGRGDDTAAVDRFLAASRGVIHIGANTGQERALYDKHNLNVIWVEPIPDVFARLQANLADYPAQRAFRCLVADQDGLTRTLHISNNGGESSSIFELAAHRELWPEVEFSDSLELETITLTTLLRQQAIDMDLYDALVLDTQGSELLVLEGATNVLPRFRFVKCEVADFEAYAGCCRLPQLDAFLRQQGFRQKHRHAFAGSAGTGRYYDVLYRRC